MRKKVKYVSDNIDELNVNHFQTTVYYAIWCEKCKLSIVHRKDNGWN